MPLRLPNPNSPEEVRRAFGELKAPFDVLSKGAAGEVLVGVGVGSVPAWGTELTALTKLTVDNLTLDGAVISSDTGAISFANENLTTTGTIAGVNVTSGADPGHTHSIYLKADGTVALTGNLAVDALVTIDGRDISVDGTALDTLVTNAGKVKVDAAATAGYLGAAFSDGVLRTSTGITYTDGGNFVTLTTNDGEIDHGSLAGLADDDHTNYHTDGRAATWLAANHETTYNHANYDTAYSWGDHASGGYLKADGSVTLAGDMAVVPGVTIDGRDLRLDGQDLDLLVQIIGKMKVDSDATVDYLGAAFNDGVLRTSTGITFTDGGNFITLTTNDGEIDHGSLAGTGDDDHTGYHTDARAATWLAANHETTFTHANYDTAYGWGDHAGLYDTVGTAAAGDSAHLSAYNHANHDTAYGWGDHGAAGYLLQNGTLPLTGDWTTGAFSIIGSDHWYLRSDSAKMFFGAGDTASIYHDGSFFTFDAQESGGGDFYFKNGRIQIGRTTSSEILFDVYHDTDFSPGPIWGMVCQLFYGSSGSGNVNFLIGNTSDAYTNASYDGNVINYIAGFECNVRHYGSGAVGAARAVFANVAIKSGGGNITTASGINIQIVNESGGSGSIVSAYGIAIENINVGTSFNFSIFTNAGIVFHKDRVGIGDGASQPDEQLQVKGSIHIGDNDKMIFGDGKDASIYYDGTDMVLKPSEVGGGAVSIQGAGGVSNPLLHVKGTDHVIMRFETTTVGRLAQLEFKTATQLWNFGIPVGGSFTLRDNTNFKTAMIWTPGNPPYTSIPLDNSKLYWGVADDCSIMYDGADMIINPKDVGSGGVKVVGDMFFGGAGTGLPYGEIYAYDSATTIVISSRYIAGKAQITAFNVDGPSNLTTPAHASDHITIVKAGVYLITCSLAVESTGGSGYKVGYGVFLNGGTVAIQSMHAHRDFASGSGSEHGSISLSGLVSLSVSDTVEVWCWNESGTSNVIVDDANLSVVMVGGA